jgi:primosomal protein N' (replication factor Y)
MYQALLRAEAPELAIAIAFLEQARDALASNTVTVNDPIPMTMTRVHNVERAQLLVESNSRPALQAFLTAWVDALRSMKSRVRWSLEVDPLDI